MAVHVLEQRLVWREEPGDSRRRLAWTGEPTSWRTGDVSRRVSPDAHVTPTTRSGRSKTHNGDSICAKNPATHVAGSPGPDLPETQVAGCHQLHSRQRPPGGSAMAVHVLHQRLA